MGKTELYVTRFSSCMSLKFLMAGKECTRLMKLMPRWVKLENDRIVDGRYSINNSPAIRDRVNA